MANNLKVEELLTFQARLLTAMNAGRGLQGLVDELAGYLKRPVLIINTLHRVLAAAGFPPHLPLASTLNLLPVEGKSNFFRISGPEDEWEAYGLAIPGQENQIQGYLLVMDGEEKEEYRALGQVVTAFASMELARLMSLKEMERRHRDNFIFDLLYNNIDNEETIVAWGELWGWNLKRPTVVVVFALEGYDHSPADQELMKSLFTVGEEAFDLNGVPSILTVKREELVGIICLEEHQRKPGRRVIKKIIDDFLSLAAPILGQRSVRLGVGRRYDSLTEIFRSYQEAKVALELGKLMRPQQETPFFADLGMARLLFSHDWQELQEFYFEIFRELSDPELMETLEAYINHGCDLKATAKALFLHPNSLRYRLKKIEEVLERDLEDLETKVDLVVAFKIKKLLGLQ